jgi:Leucine-rich repeat (LRR) protein
VKLAHALADRLALSHNQISTFPDKFAECSRLRYLNIRSNFIREFPLAVRRFYGLLDQEALLTKIRLLDLDLPNTFPRYS